MGRYSPTVRPDYYGPTADDITGAFEHERQRKRQKVSDTHEQARFEHEQRMEPLEEAFYRAGLKGKGIRGPGLGDDEDYRGEGAIRSPGDRPAAPPPEPQATEPGFDKGGGDQAPGQRPDFMAPPRKQPTMKPPAPNSAAPTSGPLGAASLPGAFNPVTGAHNDVDIGGGFYQAYSSTPEGKRALQMQELSTAGIPGMTPELASYLADNPEHAATIIDRMFTVDAKRGEDKYPHTRGEVRENEMFMSGLRQNEKTDKPPTLAEAFRIVDENYKGVGGGSLLNPSARARMAQAIAAGKLDPGNLPNVPGQGGGTPGKPLQYETVGRRHGFQTPDRTKHERELDDAGQRRTQLAGVRSLVDQARKAGRSTGDISAILQQHGLTDDEIQDVLHPAAAPKPRDNTTRF